MLIVSLAGATVTAVVFLSWRRLLQREGVSLASRIGVAAVLVCTIGVGVAVYVDRALDSTSPRTHSLASIAWPVSESVPRSPAGSGSAVQAAPVESLLGGLETRLVAQPRDARGWALLAQSYAFVANPAGAESAVQRAVALGVDEQTLRDQVRRAERSSPPQDWVQELIRRKPGQ